MVSDFGGMELVREPFLHGAFAPPAALGGKKWWRADKFQGKICRDGDSDIFCRQHDKRWRRLWGVHVDKVGFRNDSSAGRNARTRLCAGSRRMPKHLCGQDPAVSYCPKALTVARQCNQPSRVRNGEPLSPPRRSTLARHGRTRPCHFDRKPTQLAPDVQYSRAQLPLGG